MRVVALLATYNESRFVGSCVEHLRKQGVGVYLIDNASTDDTVAIAERYVDRGVIGIETLARNDVFSLSRQMRRKEELANELDADWFIHLDADERRLPPPGLPTLSAALELVDREGFNAVNFLEFSFIPTREAPNHDHSNFEHTLLTYYPLLPEFPHRLNAWKAVDDVELEWKAGHRVRFPGLRMWPRSFPMKHYLFLSVDHACEKYLRRRFDREEVDRGWHRWRDTIEQGDIRLPSESELRLTKSDDDLDASNPSQYHYFDDRWTTPLAHPG